jgi:hypothetical protein
MGHSSIDFYVVLTNYLDLGGKNKQEDGKNYLMRSFIISVVHEILFVGLKQEGEIG